MFITHHVDFDAKDFSRKSGKLFIADPASQEGLVPTVTKGTKPVTYLNSYNVADQVRCAFCDGHQRHNLGFTVGLADGSIALCGRNCAEEFFGRATARALRADLEKRQDQEKHREQVAKTLAGIEEASLHLTDTRAALEAEGLGLIRTLARILPENAQTKIRAGDVPGVDGRFLTMFSATPLIPRIRKALGHLSGVAQREGEISDVVLARAMESRAQILRWIGELSDFFREMDRFMQPDNLWHLSVYHSDHARDGAVISFRRPTHGAELHIYSPGWEIERYLIGKPVGFDGAVITNLLNQQER